MLAAFKNGVEYYQNISNADQIMNLIPETMFNRDLPLVAVLRVSSIWRSNMQLKDIPILDLTEIELTVNLEEGSEKAFAFECDLEKWLSTYVSYCLTASDSNGRYAAFKIYIDKNNTEMILKLLESPIERATIEQSY